MPTLTRRLAGKAQILAPLVLNPLMARLVEAARLRPSVSAAVPADLPTLTSMPT